MRNNKGHFKEFDHFTFCPRNGPNALLVALSAIVINIATGKEQGMAKNRILSANEQFPKYALIARNMCN